MYPKERARIKRPEEVSELSLRSSPERTGGLMDVMQEATWQKAKGTSFQKPPGSKAMTPPLAGLLRQGIQTLGAFVSSLEMRGQRSHHLRGPL